MTEAAPYSPLVPRPRYAASWTTLAAVAGQESLSLYILSLRTLLAALPMAGLILHDNFVLVETLTAAQHSASTSQARSRSTAKRWRPSGPQRQRRRGARAHPGGDGQPADRGGDRRRWCKPPGRCSRDTVRSVH